MLKRLLVLALTFLILNLFLVETVQGRTVNEKDDRRIEKIKKGVMSLGVGKDARIEVKLIDKTKISGYVSQVDNDGFVVVDKDNVSTNIPYPQVKQVKGHNLSTGAKIAIGLGILAGVLIIWLIFENYG